MTRGTAAVLLGLLAFGAADPAMAQRAGRRVTTLTLLSQHPGFFHAEDIIIRADVVGENVLAYLVEDDTRLLVLDVAPPPQGVQERLEVIGTFYDIGRLEPGDPRTSGLPIERLSGALLNKPWPGVGELPLVVASSSTPRERDDAATLRAVALDPQAYLDEGVTLTGRFRGRNLYGDLPGSPGQSRHDFVLASADAAVWVVGMEPKGEGFELDVQARIDTGRWLEVTGTVGVHSGMVVLEAGAIRLAEPVADRPGPAPRVARRQGPPPEVIFSTPLEGDTDVPTDTIVRVQFSRDMDPDSFDGRVTASYPNARVPATTAEAPAPLVVDTSYQGRNRVLEIRFEGPLDPFTALTVSLLEGITSSDGAPLEPWTLSFYSGR